MKKLALVCGILASVVGVSLGKMSSDEQKKTIYNCLSNNNKSACEALINNGLPSVEQCDKDTCGFAGAVYYQARRYKEAIPYYEKVIALGDNRGYGFLGLIYHNLQDYHNAKKYVEMGCNKGNGDLVQAGSCAFLGIMYHDGEGARQDYAKAAKLYKKACDMKVVSIACYMLGKLYSNGEGVRQNESIAKQYYGKACDLGYQDGCDDYRELNQQGVR